MFCSVCGGVWETSKREGVGSVEEGEGEGECEMGFEFGGRQGVGQVNRSMIRNATRSSE